MSRARVALLASFALGAFAANSILCRLALAAREIDAGSFTAIRLLAGAIVLVALSKLQRSPAPRTGPAGSWASAFALFLYALPFSWAYLRIGAGAGAFVLFTAVQLTMMGWALWRGERPRPMTIAGLVVALGGLVWLTLPGRFAPDPLGIAAMVVAGVAWGAYTLRGRSTKSAPLATTAANFARSLVFTPIVVAYAGWSGALHVSSRGVWLACASGALASGLGYSVWYAVLPSVSATRAAVLQLLVPVLAALAAIIVLAEPLTVRVAGGGTLIVVGVFVALRGRS